MKVLLLSPYPENIKTSIEKEGDIVHVFTDKIGCGFVSDHYYEFIVSFGYRHIIKWDVLAAIQDKAVNLHISYLPFNRGSHPNLWSHVEGTPSGVTIHKIDKGIDTGNILFQKEVFIDKSVNSFSSSYQLLTQEIERLFDLNWKYIRTGECNGWKQQGEGSFHLHKEAKSLIDIMDNGWDTNISKFMHDYMSANNQDCQKSQNL